jgi:hypothetical protein
VPKSFVFLFSRVKELLKGRRHLQLCPSPSHCCQQGCTWSIPYRQKCKGRRCGVHSMRSCTVCASLWFITSVKHVEPTLVTSENKCFYLHIHCSISRKFAGSILDDVIERFHWQDIPGRTIVLGSTQPLTAMTTRGISWGVKAAGVKGW